ncbi:YgaP family membrane protein [Orenia marismortui]|uniref:YgaP family membrane protein n=1 Tax=Orenia marismortui TaxID=46469 RepID=UPI00036129DB|nr:DUF2892 domain-containing protein [Orenia marismortui]
MTINDALRAIAGAFVLISVLLGVFYSPYWFYFTVFIGLNLLQSAFTKKCPMITLLRALGLPEYNCKTVIREEDKE